MEYSGEVMRVLNYVVLVFHFIKGFSILILPRCPSISIASKIDLLTKNTTDRDRNLLNSTSYS
jgi:hypothetical protein